MAIRSRSKPPRPSPEAFHRLLPAHFKPPTPYAVHAKEAFLNKSNTHHVLAEAALCKAGESGQAICLEFACGTGEFLLHAASRNLSKLFIGIDSQPDCILRALIAARNVEEKLQASVSKERQKTKAAKPALASDAGLANVFFYYGTALDFLRHEYPKLRVSEILVNFPDPWPKKRHSKRRLLSHEFLLQATKQLQAKGLLVTATDSPALYLQHTNLFSKIATLQPQALLPSQLPLPYYAFASRYQQKNLSHAKKVFYTKHKKQVT